MTTSLSDQGIQFADGSIMESAAKLGVRNKIINGAFQINQRGYASGAATTAGQYTLDRWKVTGTGGITFSTVDNKTTVTIPAGQTLQQVIEGLNLQSGTHVLSWAGTAQGRINGGTYGTSGAVTATAVGGTDMTVEFGPGTVSLVQLEAGSRATPFEHRPIGLELTLCQRYLPAFNSTGAHQAVGMGRINTTTEARCFVYFPVEARTPPTGITVPDATMFGTAWTNNGGGNLLAGTLGGVTLPSTKGGELYYTIAGGTLGYSATLYANAPGAQILFTGCEL